MTERSRYAKYRDTQRGGPPREPKPHGTWAAVMRHRRAGEPLCKKCLVAQQEHNAEQYARRKAAS